MASTPEPTDKLANNIFNVVSKSTTLITDRCRNQHHSVYRASTMLLPISYQRILLVTAHERKLEHRVFGVTHGNVPIRCAIHGIMHGLGKTQLNVQFANMSFDQARYSHVFWSSTTTVEKLHQGASARQSCGSPCQGTVHATAAGGIRHTCWLLGL